MICALDPAEKQVYDTAGDRNIATSGRLARPQYESQSTNNVYDALNRLNTAYVKGPFLVAVKDLSGGIVEQDFTGQKALATGQTITGFSLDMSANSLGIKLANPHLVSRIELMPGTSEHRLRRESIDIFVSDDNSENTYHLVPRDNWTFTKAPGGVVILEFKPALNTTYIKVHCKYDDRNETLGFDSTKATFKQAGGAFIGTMVKVYHLAEERTENYTYDAVGNRLTSTYTYESSDTEERQTYQYYTNSDRLRTDGKYAFKYDANGNLVEKGTAFTIAGDVVTFTATYGEGIEYWKYDYDALNRLVKVTKSGLTANDGTVVEYVYDPTGLRLMKTNGTSSTLYAFDLAGSQIYDTAGEQEHCYIWAFGKTLARVDGDKDSTVKYFFHTDMLGSIVLVTGDGGRIVWTGDVTPFGERVSVEGSFEGAVRFTGKEYDEDTGLYYFNARWYDSALGRFVTEDVLPGDPLNPMTRNRYAYCESNPLILIDPSGWLSQSTVTTDTDGADTYASQSSVTIKNQNGTYKVFVFNRAVDPETGILVSTTLMNTRRDYDTMYVGGSYTVNLNGVQAAEVTYTAPAEAAGDVDNLLSGLLMMTGLDFIKDIPEALTGKNLVTGERISPLARALIVLPCVSGALLKGAKLTVEYAGGVSLAMEAVDGAADAGITVYRSVENGTTTYVGSRTISSDGQLSISR